MNKKPKNNINIRSSAAEYLTFVSATGNQEQAVEMRYEDENIWLTQKMMAELYGVSVPAINQHINSLIKSGEIDLATIKQYLIVQNKGTRAIQRKTDHYNLQAIISVGFKIENERADRENPEIRCCHSQELPYSERDGVFRKACLYVFGLRRASGGAQYTDDHGRLGATAG